MEAKIVNRDVTTVVGLMRRFNDEKEHVGELWGEFMTRSAQLEPLRIDECHYGVAFLTDQEGVWDYLASVAVGRDTGHGRRAKQYRAATDRRRVRPLLDRFPPERATPVRQM